MLTNVRYPRWSYLLLIASLSVIGVATIYPFRFVIPEGFSVKSIAGAFEYSSIVKDYAQNVLLFIPLGVSIAAIAGRQRLGIWSILSGFFIAAAVSTTVELTQLFLPTRVSNLTDIICNSLGGLVGAALYYWHIDLIKFAIAVIKVDRHRLSLKSLSIAIASYCTIVAMAIWILLVNANLSNWDEDFYLTIGNEITGDRPWNGYLNSLYISDRSLEQSQLTTNPDRFLSHSDDVIVSLKSTGEDPSLQNSEHFDLFWYDGLSTSNLTTSDRVSEGSGILLNKDHWLKTPQPVPFINRQLKDSSEFSLFLDLATNDLTQRGPARILSLSNGIYRQNLLIGQMRQDLIFRLRTPITGYIPIQPKFVLPDFFNDYSDRQILITFASRKLTFYIDREEQYSFVFDPSVSFYSYLPWSISNWTINLKDPNTTKYQQVFYLIIVAPLIVLFGELTYLFFWHLLYN